MFIIGTAALSIIVWTLNFLIFEGDRLGMNEMFIVVGVNMIIVYIIKKLWTKARKLTKNETDN